MTALDLFSHRRTLELMTRQDLKTSYSRYKLGLLWTLAEPFSMAIFMWAVFALIFGSNHGIGLTPFIVYLVTGMLPFQWLTSSINKGPKTFRKFEDMVALSPLPITVWPMRLVLVGAAEFAMAIPIIVLLAVMFGAKVTWGIIFFPVAIAMQFALCMGCAMIGAALGTRLPDIDKLTSLVTRGLFWLSPILWAQRSFPPWLEKVIYINPFHMILDFYRASVWPDQVLSDWHNYAISTAVIAALLAIGAIMMRSTVKEVRKIS